MNWRGRGDVYGQEIRVRDMWEVDGREVSRRGSSEIDPRGSERNFAPFAVMEIPWMFVSFLGLLFSLVPGIVWATSDTTWISDPPRKVNTQCAGCDHSPGVLHKLSRTGEGFGDGAGLRMSRVLDRSEQLRWKIN